MQYKVFCNLTILYIIVQMICFDNLFRSFFDTFIQTTDGAITFTFDLVIQNFDSDCTHFSKRYGFIFLNAFYHFNIELLHFFIIVKRHSLCIHHRIFHVSFINWVVEISRQTKNRNTLKKTFLLLHQNYKLLLSGRMRTRYGTYCQISVNALFFHQSWNYPHW